MDANGQPEQVPAIQPTDVDALVKANVVDLQARFDPVLNQVRQVSEEIIANAKVEVLGDASSLLGLMTGELNKLKPGFFARVFGTDQATKKKLLERKTIKTVLEEHQAELALTKEQLAQNISKVEATREAAKNAVLGFRRIIAEMEAEKAVIEKAALECDQTDMERVREYKVAVLRYKKTINDARALLFTQEGTIVQANAQKQERETLYQAITMLAPHLQSLLEQQLTSFIEQLEVRLATQKVKAFRDGVNEMARLNAEMMREDAIAVAQTANQPIITEETINSMADNILGMIKGVDEAIKSALEEGDKTAATAQRRSQEIKAALLELKTPEPGEKQQ